MNPNVNQKMAHALEPEMMSAHQNVEENVFLNMSHVMGHVYIMILAYLRGSV